MKKVLIALFVIVLLFLGVVAMQPATFEIQRSIDIEAPADVPYAMVGDFHQWEAWSPWEKLDPNLKKTFEGTPGEVGSSYAWIGNKDVGEGKMTLTALEPDRSIDIELEFLKPWKSRSQTTFTFAPAGEATQVNWKMSGNNDLMGKAFGLFADMDSMVGGDFEKGLAALKAASETKAQERRRAEAEPEE